MYIVSGQQEINLDSDFLQLEWLSNQLITVCNCLSATIIVAITAKKKIPYLLETRKSPGHVH